MLLAARCLEPFDIKPAIETAENFSHSEWTGN